MGGAGLGAVGVTLFRPWRSKEFEWVWVHLEVRHHPQARTNASVSPPPNIRTGHSGKSVRPGFLPPVSPAPENSATAALLVVPAGEELNQSPETGCWTSEGTGLVLLEGGATGQTMT